MNCRSFPFTHSSNTRSRIDEEPRTSADTPFSDSTFDSNYSSIGSYVDRMAELKQAVPQIKVPSDGERDKSLNALASSTADESYLHENSNNSSVNTSPKATYPKTSTIYSPVTTTTRKT